MIAYAMLYAIAVGVPVLLATWVLAAVLRHHGRPERMVWLGGLALSFALPVLGLRGVRAVDAVATAGQGSAGTSSGVVGLPEIFVVSEGSAGAGIGEVLVGLWIVVSVLLALRLAVSALRLARLGRAWRRSTMDGADVWLTGDVGPAVAGLLRPRVLVPSWLVDMPAQRRALVLLHEQEHIRARDPWIMLASRVAPVLTPWNPVVWILSARLLRAVELDCDRRVLRHRPDVRAYGHTLIDISDRHSGRLVAVAAFAESEAPLRSRILNMTTPSRAVSILALLTSMVLGVVLLVAAFEIPVPTISAQITIGPDPVNPVGSVEADEPDRVEADRVERQAERPVDASETIQRLREEGSPAEPRRAQAEADRRSEVESGVEAGGPPSELGRAPTFTPFTVAPVLQNMQEVQRELVREYPMDLRDAGIGGRVLIWFFIDEDGRVRQTYVNESSGHPALDQAALNVASVYRFSPALNRDERVAVWVALPISFQVR